MWAPLHRYILQFSYSPMALFGGPLMSEKKSGANTYKKDDSIPWLILGLRPANERCRYKVTLSLTGWEQT